MQVSEKTATGFIWISLKHFSKSYTFQIFLCLHPL
jgi:hypothetical protein